MKTLKLVFLTIIFIMSGCKNPLDNSGTGQSIISDAYNAFLDLPSSFRFTYYEMQSSQVTLYWSASDRADSYQVRYGTMSGVYTLTASCNSSPCTITTLTNGTTYYFTVIASNPKGSTSVSSEFAITPLNAPSVPTGLSTTSASGTVTLSWSASTGVGSIKYKVLRSATSGSGYVQIATDITSTSYLDASVTNGTIYYYVVRSFNEFGEGSNSNEVTGRSYQNFLLNIPYTAGTESSYIFSNTNVSELVGGVFRLSSSDQTDDDNTTSGFGGATYTGAQYDSVNGYVRLNATTNNAELDPSWTPKWGSLKGY